MKDQELNQMISDFKEIGYTVSRVEKEVGFSNGIIGKALSGKAKLNDEKINLLKEFHEKAMNSDFQHSVPQEAPQKKQNKALLVTEENPKIVQKSYFSKLLLEFNHLIAEQPPVSSVKNKLNELYQKTNNSELNYRQVDAIRARIVNYINGNYGNTRNQLKTS